MFFIFLNTKLTLIVFSILLFSSYFFYFLSRKKLSYWGQKRLSADGERIKKLQDAYNLIQEIKLYKKYDYIKNLFALPNRVSAHMGRNQVILQNVPRLWTEFFAIFSFMMAVTFLLSYSSISNNFITDLGVFGAATIRLMPSANKILSCIHTFRYASPSITTIGNLLDEVKKHSPIETKNKKQNNHLNFSNKININNINFNYDTKIIFENFSCSIKKNNVTCIIGKSGRGKSTLVNLLLGFIRPSEGSIDIDGNILNKINIHEWHEKISFVPQNVILFQGTLKENIIFGDEKNNFDEIHINNAVKLANLSELIDSLPDGLNTMVSEKGSNFSGGQIQRIGIARALYRKPELLIFDEPTSSLDSDTEMKLISEIVSLKSHATIVIVTHNSKIINICDYSIDLDE